MIWWSSTWKKKDGRLLRVRKANEFTTPTSFFEEEYLIYRGNLVYGLEFDHSGELTTVSKCTYDKGNIVKYERSDCAFDEYADLRSEEYKYQDHKLSEVILFSNIVPSIGIYEESKYIVDYDEGGNIVRLIGGFVRNGDREREEKQVNVNPDCVKIRKKTNMFQMNLIKKLKTSYSIKLSSDNRFLCHNMSSKTIIYDLNTWEKKMELNKPNYQSYIRFSKNNEYLLIKSTTGTICVYDTVNFQLVKTIQSKKPLKLVEGDVNFTQDNLMILDVLQTHYGQQIASIDIHTGEYNLLTEFENSITLIKYNHFIPNENTHLFTLSYVNKEDFRENKIIKVNEPINKQSIEVISNPGIEEWSCVIFDSIHDVYILVQDYEILIVDSGFKNIVKRVSLVDHDSLEQSGYFFIHNHMEETGYFQHIHLSHDSRFIVLTYSDCIFILRYEDLKILWAEKIQYACFAEFSKDDQYLLVGTWKNGYVLENNLQ